MALTLVLKQVYSWEIYMVSVKPRPIQDFKHIPPSQSKVAEVYIPDKLPPLEVGGCQFKIQRSTPPSHLRTILIPFQQRAL